jgi:hypothetical protein
VQGWASHLRPPRALDSGAVAKRSHSPEPAHASRIPPRLALLGTGVVLGAVWGSVMWLIFELAGRDSGARGWAYIAVTTAMIGGGVAAIFGANAARKRGERVSPRLPYRRRGGDKT